VQKCVTCGYAGSSLEVKIETDATEIKTEADSNDITEYSHGHMPCTGMFVLMMIHLLTLICCVGLRHAWS